MISDISMSCPSHEMGVLNSRFPETNERAAELWLEEAMRGYVNVGRQVGMAEGIVNRGTGVS